MRDELPLPDYNRLQAGSLTSRIRTLGADDLQTLITYEKAHANRVQVMQVMQNRLTSLRAGAQTSGGDPAAATPEPAPGADVASKASEATSGPPVTPPPHGAPAEPGRR